MWRHGAELPVKLIPEKCWAYAGSVRRHCAAKALYAARPPMYRNHVTSCCALTQYECTQAVWKV